MYLKYPLVLLLFIFSTLSASGQETNKQIEDEINQQVWQVFKRSYEARDYETFNSIHDKDVLRVNDGGIKLGSEYLDGNKKWTKPREGTQINIDFAFETRQYRGDLGYEVGYYRVQYASGEKLGPSYYGRFHVVLRKNDGRWTIVQDYDTSQVGATKIDASFFDAANLLQLDK
ncbi:MAG: nuclear transport factor 2 family protein [Flavobacteriaceae bacterium]|nr:nuclear transport factor 2 family protein [Flavobacteriaceae bacterium]